MIDSNLGERQEALFLFMNLWPNGSTQRSAQIFLDSSRILDSQAFDPSEEIAILMNFNCRERSTGLSTDRYRAWLLK